MLTYERLEFDSVDWETLLDEFDDRTVYQTSAWIHSIARIQNGEPVLARIRDGQRVVGYFPGLVVRKLRMRILGSPFKGWTTSYMGPNLHPGVSRREAIEALLRFAFGELRCVHLEFMDRNLTLDQVDGMGLQHQLQNSYEVDLTPGEQGVFNNLSKSCRWCVRKAERNGVVTEMADDPEFADDYYAQLTDVFAKQSLVPTYGIERVRALIKHLLPTGALLLVRARDSQGRCIATGIFLGMNRTMHLWGAASWRPDQHLLPNEAVQWYAMKYWLQRGMERYDMEGGGSYKRKYGGRTIVVPWFRKSKSRAISLMRDVAQKAYGIRQKALGTWRDVRRRG